ncbi:MAG TPA: hypothetical protein VJK30_01870 [Coxiellaceae bacterium]|nr:MAG: hypothetical protein A3E81_04080 [Gammaproteobacteria bacterium RIFCSPHIGHO2_12_FULL_36_30]HLB56067.1 hypothetical protein [Coxiellaceae bacterium]
MRREQPDLHLKYEPVFGFNDFGNVKFGRGGIFFKNVSVKYGDEKFTLGFTYYPSNNTISEVYSSKYSKEEEGTFSEQVTLFDLASVFLNSETTKALIVTYKMFPELNEEQENAKALEKAKIKQVLTDYEKTGVTIKVCGDRITSIDSTNHGLLTFRKISRESKAWIVYLYTLFVNKERWATRPTNPPGKMLSDIMKAAGLEMTPVTPEIIKAPKNDEPKKPGPKVSWN